MGLFKNILNKVFEKNKKFNENFFEDLEEKLVSADVGISSTEKIITDLRNRIKENKYTSLAEVEKELKTILNNYILEGNLINNEGLKVILFTGINGVGKTTSLAKLANYLKKKGYKIKIGAADTFRAAAIEQLSIWAEKIKVPIIKHQLGSDSGAVVFDTLSSAISDNTDYAIIDTAGRMHTSSDLMRELQKIKKVALKKVDEKNIENIIVVDSTAGQNSFFQVETFDKYIPVTGVFLSKYDSSSKGGIIIRISNELKKPIKFLGYGEKIEDIKPFSKSEFINELI